MDPTPFNSPPTPAPPTDGPTGTLYGFAERRQPSYTPATPAAAQEPPWVVAAREIGDTLALRYSDTFAQLWTDISKRACEQHAAALAQERDAHYMCPPIRNDFEHWFAVRFNAGATPDLWDAFRAGAAWQRRQWRAK
jgi:hypothetical protein